MRNSSPPFDVLLCLLVWPHAGLNSLEGLCALRSPVTACGIAAPRTDCDGALPDDSLRCSNCFACDETKPAWVRNGDEPMRVSPLHSMLVRMPRGTSSIRETAAGSVFGMWRRMSKSHQTPYEFAPPRSWPTSDVARAQLHTANYESWNSSTRCPRDPSRAMGRSARPRGRPVAAHGRGAALSPCAKLGAVGGRGDVSYG